MLTVVIKDNGEDNVTQYTYDLLFRELKDIPGSELIIAKNWSDGLVDIDNKYICFVEADCLVGSGYFSSQLGLLKKDPYFRKLAMLSGVTCVGNWANRFYGYRVDLKHGGKVIPQLQKRSGVVDAVQVGFVPGSVIRVNMLNKAIATLKDCEFMDADLIDLSVRLSLAFWRQGDGNRVHLNPNALYATTEMYVNDISKIPADIVDLAEKFERESI